MTPDQQALRDAFLTEMWPVCRELPYGDRVAKRNDDRAQQRQLEERAAELDLVLPFPLTDDRRAS